MVNENKNSFSFIVVCYNHEKYIVDHLESIKYQILNFGSQIDIDILINDDCSKDQTIKIIELWLDSNFSLFKNVLRFYNSQNIGTAASVSQLIKAVNTASFKMTAGDDVYSFENIFENCYLSKETAFMTGFPLYFKDNYLFNNYTSTLLSLATSIIYKKNKNLISRFEEFSYYNAPNLFYNLECAQNNHVLSYLRKFQVTEDWPLQIGISREFPDRKFRYIPKIFVYYRRTETSTYLIANNKFSLDKEVLFRDLIANSSSSFLRLRLKMRLFCFKNKNKLIFKIFNIELYIFFIKSILNSFKIFHAYFNFDFKIKTHRQHLNNVLNSAHLFKENNKSKLVE